MNDLSINVEVMAGASINDVCTQMVALADRIGISVRAQLNGVRVLARPGVDAAKLYEAWSRELESERPYKYAIV